MVSARHGKLTTRLPWVKRISVAETRSRKGAPQPFPEVADHAEEFTRLAMARARNRTSCRGW